MFDGIDQLGLFIVAGLLLNLTPGPDVLYIVRHGMRGGQRAGMVAALGIGAGVFVHVVAAAVGLGALIAASATTFTVLKWLGAVYLVYMGLGMLISRGAGPGSLAGLGRERPAVAGVMPLRQVFTQGFWTNALNPKVALFFLAFVPQFIAHDAAHKTWTFLLLGLIFSINALPVNLAWGLGAAWLATRLQRLSGSLVWLDRLAGALFLYFGIRLATAEQIASST